MKIKASVTITLVELLQLFARSAGAMKKRKETGLPAVDYMPQTSKQFEGIIVPLDEQDYEESLKILPVIIKNLDLVPKNVEKAKIGYYWVRMHQKNNEPTAWMVAFRSATGWRIPGNESEFGDDDIADIQQGPIQK